MKGYVALTTILVITPLLLLTGLDSVYRNMTSLLTTKMNYEYQILRSNSQTCIEETVYRVKRNPYLQGDLVISGDQYVCDIQISDIDGQPGIKLITINALGNNNTNFKIRKELNTNTNPFELSNY